MPLDNAADIPAEKEEDDELLPIIMKMKTDNRIVLYMHYYEGYSVKEIAGILGTNESAVTSKLYRGRKQNETIFSNSSYSIKVEDNGRMRYHVHLTQPIEPDEITSVTIGGATIKLD